MRKRLIEKIRVRFWVNIVQIFRNTKLYPLLYKSYWHFLLHKRNKGDLHDIYFTARPNPGAGIGHQMANWISGYWFARQFELKFAHFPFSTFEWDDFLGFGQNEITVNTLLKNGYKKRRLPLFDEKKVEEVKRTERIIQSYTGKKVVFVAEQDQFYHDQFGVIDDIKRKFFAAPARKNDNLVYSSDHFNIAIHVRRGDIMSDINNQNWHMRIISNDYFLTTLTNALKAIEIEKPVHIFFFSQGHPDDFHEFNNFENLHWCLEMGAKESFLHMVYADLLITSKSSFSYKPALLNKGIKICPKDFWHGYPKNKNWILASSKGHF